MTAIKNVAANELFFQCCFYLRTKGKRRVQPNWEFEIISTNAAESSEIKYRMRPDEYGNPKESFKIEGCCRKGINQRTNILDKSKQKKKSRSNFL